MHLLGDRHYYRCLTRVNSVLKVPCEGTKVSASDHSPSLPEFGISGKKRLSQVDGSGSGLSTCAPASGRAG